MNGLLVLDKPSGITSRQVVDRVEAWFPGARAGHAGTLDPLATGVLVVCLGQATRLVEYVQRMAKTYSVRIRLGAWSDTDDADGVIHEVKDAQPPTRRRLEEHLRGLVGEIEQAPPTYSAAHVEGQRAYQLARKGKAVELPPRRVVVYRIDLVVFDYPRLDLVVDCGKGTYIRSLARELGRHLGCGGYVERLQRTRIGPFRLEAALDVDAGPAAARENLRPLSAAVAELPSTIVADDVARRLRQGQRVPVAEPLPIGGIALLNEAGDLVGIGEYSPSAQLLRPVKML